MGWFHDNSEQAQAHNQVQGGQHKPHLTHEILGGAASYEAAKAYEAHCAKNGAPVSHGKAKELLAGFAGAYVDREAETKGMNFIDKEKAKHHAKKHAEEGLAANNAQGWK